ncbi:hypothetical protein SCD90_12725 [Terrihabitans sp. PJ23]|uniref:Uncharacterized protein n=1 Tax=Terrihabitans rhizophilus TaxID=3092662 RepID=A0ABU4RQ06_9HYPH|nr:hypothetical protein [Terrihabitans sp. PJ23]
MTHDYPLFGKLDNPDAHFAVVTGDLDLGRISQVSNEPEIWQWVVHGLEPPELACLGTSSSRDGALEAVGRAWQAWLQQAGLPEDNDQSELSMPASSSAEPFTRGLNIQCSISPAG